MVQYRTQILKLYSRIILVYKLMKTKGRKEDNKLININNNNKCSNNLILHKHQLLNSFRGNKIYKILDFIKTNFYLQFRINFNKINLIINKMASHNGFKINRLNGNQTMIFIMKLGN
jgi:hypothetical protein